MTITDQILEFLHYHPGRSRADIMSGVGTTLSAAQFKRILAETVDAGWVAVEGRARATRYSITPRAHLLRTVDLKTYYAKDIDERVVQTGFNFDLLRTLLPAVSLFTEEESRRLAECQRAFAERVAALSPAARAKEMERLGIDLSWKSSQIEGNTYTLLETERLIREREEAEGKRREEAVMILNHKEALRFLLEAPDYLSPVTVRRIEDIHSLLVADLGVDRGIRTHRVGITGTNYRPLDNEFQIREAMEDLCRLVNGKEDVFEKALLALVLLSYVQPFMDGNKRTARIVANAIFLAHGHCPLSFRTVRPDDYREALLLFYEQNNLSAFKRLFVEQVEFAVRTYF